MKSSTIRRSALSKASMDVFENLANEGAIEYNQAPEQNNDDAPSEYYRESENSHVDNKSKEIDLLWQTFKSAQLNTNSTLAHVLTGFVLGVVTTVLAVSLFGMFVANSDNTSLKNKLPIFGVKNNAQKIEETIDTTPIVIDEQNIPSDEADIPAVVQEETAKSKKTEKVSKNEKKEVKSSVQMKKYIIKDGDTVEAIIIRNYGSYTPQRAQAIMQANNLKDLDHISIDQELLLPIEK